MGINKTQRKKKLFRQKHLKLINNPTRLITKNKVETCINLKNKRKILIWILNIKSLKIIYFKEKWTPIQLISIKTIYL